MSKPSSTVEVMKYTLSAEGANKVQMLQTQVDVYLRFQLTV